MNARQFTLYPLALTMTSSKLKPDWTGADLLSRFVNLLIQTKPIYSLMKYQARKMMIGTAEKNGIPWRQRTQELETSVAEQQLTEIADPDLVYPDYYKVPFHAYKQGHLCWLAACEAEPATYAMGLRIWPQEPLTWEVAQTRFRSSFHQVLADYAPKTVRDILDIGCSIGISTLNLHHYYQSHQNEPVRTIGLDLSPYMLTVAKIRDTDAEIAEWKHANAENTGLPDGSFDLITLQFVLHELPRQATQRIFREVLRLLRPQGCLAIADNDPKSKVIQNRPPVLFTLMKSTEPWTDDYFTFDVEAALQATGFEHQTTLATDPRHRAIIARKP